VKRYSDVKNIDGQWFCAKNEKGGQNDFTAFEKNSRLSLRSGQVILRKKSLNISCDTIRRRLLAHEISKHSEETATVQKTRRKKIHLGKRKFGSRLGQGNFFEQKFFLDTFFHSSYLVYPYQ